MPNLDEDVSGCPSEIRSGSEWQLMGAVRPESPAQPVWAGSCVLMYGSNDLVDTEEVFLPILDKSVLLYTMYAATHLSP